MAFTTVYRLHSGATCTCCKSKSDRARVIGKIAVGFADMGERSLKNIARPVRAYAVVRDGLVAD